MFLYVLSLLLLGIQAQPDSLSIYAKELRAAVKEQEKTQIFERANRLLSYAKKKKASKDFVAYAQLGKGWGYELSVELDKADSMATIVSRMSGLADSLVLDRIVLQAEIETGRTNHRQAINFGKKVLSFISEDKIDQFPFPYTKALNLLGDAYRNLSQIDSQLVYLYRLVEFYEKRQDESNLAFIYGNIALGYDVQGDTESAIQFTKRAIETSKKEGRYKNISTYYNNLGTFYRKKEEYDLAEESLLKAIEFGQKAGLKNFAMNYFNLGNIASDTENYERALDYYEKSYKDSEKAGIPMGLLYNNYGKLAIYSKMGKHQRVADIYSIALTQARELGAWDVEEAILDEAITSLSALGKYKSALDAQKRITEIRDSVHSKKVEQRVAELRTEFETERKEQENQLLKAQKTKNEATIKNQLIIVGVIGLLLTFSIVGFLYVGKQSREREKTNRELARRQETIEMQNEELTAQAEELSKLNDIKNKVFTLVSHDLRGPLFSLKNALFLINEKAVDEKTKDQMLDTVERDLSQNASMLENLLFWAQSQMEGISIHLENTKIAQIVKRVLNELNVRIREKNIAVSLTIPDDLQVETDGEVLTIILRNLVQNSVKFVEVGGKIDICIYHEAQCLQMKVSDNGLGIEKEKLKQLFKRQVEPARGTKNEKGSGLGLLLIQDFVTRLGGTIQVESILGKGTTFMVSIPAVSVQAGSEVG